MLELKKFRPLIQLAGDQFAAGFLYGMASNCDLETSCKMGNIAAGEVIGAYWSKAKGFSKEFIYSVRTYLRGY